MSGLDMPPSVLMRSLLRASALFERGNLGRGAWRIVTGEIPSLLKLVFADR